MDILTGIEERRTIKIFDKAYHLKDSEIDALNTAALWAPSSYNIQHSRIVKVQDTDQRKALREAAFDQAQVTDASEVWIICADTQAWQKEPARYWRNADQGKRDMLVGMMTDFYQGKPELQRDEAIRSGAFMAQNIMLAATSLGLGAGPMIGFDAEKVADIINLPDDHVVVLMLVIGKAAQDAFPRGGQLSVNEVVFNNKFS